MYSGRQHRHPFVDDAVPCDSSEANRAWSSLPAETLACLPITDRPGWYDVQTAPPSNPASKNHIFFPSVGRASVLQPCSADSGPWTALLYRGREMDTRQRRVTFQHHLLWTAPIVHIPEAQTEMETSGMTANILRHSAGAWCQSRYIMEDIVLFVKNIHMVIRLCIWWGLTCYTFWVQKAL